MSVRTEVSDCQFKGIWKQLSTIVHAHFYLWPGFFVSSRIVIVFTKQLHFYDRVRTTYEILFPCFINGKNN